MDKSKRIYDRFEFWSVADCSCEFCLYKPPKDRPCALEVCCVADIREEAERREQAAQAAPTGGFSMSAGGDASCPA